MSPSINSRIAVGASWMVAMRVGDRLIGLVSIVILARLLLPEDFGMVAYAMAFLGILEVFFQFSFQTVLIRDQDAKRESYDTAWTLDLITGLVLAVLLVIGAQPAARFFNEPEVETVLYWLAILPAVRGLQNIGVVDFQKDMNFNKEFYFNFSVRCVGTLLTITLAVILRSYWALVAGMLTRTVLRVLLSYVMSPFRPRLGVSEFTRVFGFSKWLLLQNLFYGIVERAPAIIIGRFHSAQVLAFFNMASELSHLASQELASPVRRALFPGMAKIADDQSQMIQTLTSSIAIIVLIALPLTVGVAVAAPLVIPVLLGNNWVEIVPIIQVLSIGAIAYILYSNSHIVLYTADRPDVTAWVSGLQAAILVPLLLWLTPEHGAIGAAWAFSLTNVVIFVIIDYAIVVKLMKLRIRNVIALVWRSVVGATLMGIAVHQSMLAIDGAELPNVLSLVVCVGAGAIAYTGTVLMLWYASGRPHGPEAWLFSNAAKLLARFNLIPARFLRDAA